MELSQILNPTDDFRYTPLALDAIRLIRILPRSTPEALHCAIEHRDNYFSASERPGYVALSYCWGDPWDRRTITLNGSAFRVTTNLWHALSAILQYHNTAQYYWVDAICLNQHDVEERNHQVHQMWRIYAQAEQVFAWMGPEDDDTESLIADMRRVASLGVRNFSQVHRRFQAVPNRPLFQRTWIIQELLQARRLSFIWGKHSLESDLLFHFQVVWGDTQAGRLIASRYHSLVSPHDPQTLADPDAKVDSLHKLLVMYSRSQCSDRRDKIFAMIGHPFMQRLDPSTSFRPDYRLNTRDLFFNFLVYCDVVLFPPKGLYETAYGQIMVIYSTLVRALEDEEQYPGFLATTFHITEEDVERCWDAYETRLCSRESIKALLQSHAKRLEGTRLWLLANS